MIPIIIISHGKFCEELLKSAELIVGKQEFIETVPLLEGESPETFFDEVKKKIEEFRDKGYQEILVLSDLFGGSTSNTVTRITLDKNIEVVTGVNMPMLLEVIINRDSADLNELTKIAEESGKEGIVNVKKKIEEFMKKRGV
ncbi:MAG: PTS sugar transporter subunit IIA [Candidatus Asgardarchaeia archaeon]